MAHKARGFVDIDGTLVPLSCSMAPDDADELRSQLAQSLRILDDLDIRAMERAFVAANEAQHVRIESVERCRAHLRRALELVGAPVSDPGII